MFETLTKGFRAARNRLMGVTELDEANLDPALRDVRLSLLEADVELGVVKRFLERVKSQIVGETIQNEVEAKGKKIKVGPAERFIKGVSGRARRDDGERGTGHLVRAAPAADGDHDGGSPGLR